MAKAQQSAWYVVGTLYYLEMNEQRSRVYGGEERSRKVFEGEIK